jgi:IK cytokine
MAFATPLGRAVFAAVFNPPKINVSELFLPRRTAFVYELDGDAFASDIPTTLRRSKADCPPVRPASALYLECFPQDYSFIL